MWTLETVIRTQHSDVGGHSPNYIKMWVALFNMCNKQRQYIHFTLCNI